jgi:hypothetical protein
VSERRFGFVQWEFAGRLGPDPGRYPVRRFAGDDVREVLVIGGIEGRRRGSRLRGRRPRVADAPEPATVEVTRATVIDATPLHERDAAEEWLDRAAGPDAGPVVAGALAVLNRAVAAHRVASADPFIPDADAHRALVTRIGYGVGEQVADGEWEAARVLPVPRERHPRVHAPQQRVAALLSGRDVALACEELVLRARRDLDAGREREAAMQAHLALEAAVRELESWRGRGDLGDRVDELSGHREAAAAAANTALDGGLDPDAAAAVAAALNRLEAALRARAARDS